MITRTNGTEAGITSCRILESYAECFVVIVQTMVSGEWAV
jgi:hypothetical protein